MNMSVLDAPRVHQPAQPVERAEPLWRSVVAVLILGAVIALMVLA